MLVHQAQVDPATDAARRARFPAGAALTFADMEQAGREPALDALREAEPVSWVPAIGGWLVTSDGDEHARLRKPFEPPFKIGAVERTFTDAIREEATSLLDGQAGHGGDRRDRRAIRCPVRRADGRPLGISLEDTRQINAFDRAFAAASVYDGNPEPQRLADKARAGLNQLLHRELDRSRQQRGRSITSMVAESDACISRRRDRCPAPRDHVRGH